MRNVLSVDIEKMNYTGASRFEEFYPILSPTSFEILRECHTNPTFILDKFPESERAKTMSAFCTSGFHRLGIAVINEKKKKNMTASKTTSSTTQTST